MPDKLAAEQAARETPFGKHRIALGYSDISVEYSAMGDVTLANGTVLKNVPSNVYINANPTTGGPIPTIPTDDRVGHPSSQQSGRDRGDQPLRRTRR